MSAAFKKVIDEIDALSIEEKALVAHRLLESLDAQQDEGVEQAWDTLADKRMQSINSGAVQTISWDEVKQQIKG